MRRCNRLAVVGIFGVFLLAGLSAVAEDIFSDQLEKSPEELRAEMSASQLLTEAGNLLQQENYYAAVPYLTEYLDRMTELENNSRVSALMQNVRLKLGRVFIYQGDYESAARYFEEYLDNKPVFRRREALKSLAVIYFKNQEYKKSIAAVTNAFASPSPVEEEEEELAPVPEELSEDELGGLSRRQVLRYQRENEKEAEKEEKRLIEPIAANKPSEEPEYTLADKVLLNMTLGESYIELGQWEESVEPLRFVVDHAEQMDRRGFAIMKLVRSLSELDRSEEVRDLIMDLAQDDMRFDIRVNMAMMNAATTLYNSGEYDSALAIYRMILSRRVLADYQLKKINELREMVGLPFMTVTLATNEAGRIETVMGYSYAEKEEENTRGLASFEMPEKPDGLDELEEALGGLMGMAPYEDDLIYRMGQLYLECGRPWEALGSLDLAAKRAESDSARMKQACCSALQVMVDPLALYDRVEKRAYLLLDKYKEGVAPRQAAYYLTMAYQWQEQYEKIKTLRPYFDSFSIAVSSLEKQYDCELDYMQAIADLMLLNYKEAQVGFKKVLDKYPGSHQEENLRYWYAVTHLFLQDYEAAYGLFEEYLKTYPEGIWISSTWYQTGICLFALEKYDTAKQRFTYVIDTFPDSDVYPDACSMRGDLFGSEGLYDEATRDYREAIATAKKPSQAEYAVFQMAALFEIEALEEGAEERYNDIIALVDSYLDSYGEDANVAKAAYWIGKTKIAQGLVGEAIDSYIETIVRYGDDVKQDGVDLIIGEVVDVAQGLDDDEGDLLKQTINDALDETDSVTVQLRLRVMLAKLDGTTIELGESLINELDDLTQAPSPVLSVICDASFANEDYSRAKDIFDIFRKDFEDSEFMRSAYKLRVYDLFSQGLFDEAMKIVIEAQDLYGVDGDTAWVQLMKGRVLMELGDMDTARETFRMVFGVRFWRGEPYAEATYRLGELAEKEGNLKEAFTWYQRTYFIYKGIADGSWAAEGYLASARCLRALGRLGDMRNTYRAMLYDKYVNTLPQADVARQMLGADEVLEIQQKIAAGMQTNLVITVETEESE